ARLSNAYQLLLRDLSDSLFGSILTPIKEARALLGVCLGCAIRFGRDAHVRLVCRLGNLHRLGSYSCRVVWNNGAWFSFALRRDRRASLTIGAAFLFPALSQAGRCAPIRALGRKA